MTSFKILAGQILVVVALFVLTGPAWKAAFTDWLKEGDFIMLALGTGMVFLVLMMGLAVGQI